MKCHVIAPFHTKVDPVEFSHCAFTQKSYKLVRMLKIAGYEVVEYANGGSCSNADEKVVILSNGEFDQFYPKQRSEDFVGNYCNYTERGAPLFRQRCVAEMRKRVDMGDVICHTFGHATNHLVAQFPYAHHVETGIGYPDTPFGCWRIFESESWRHYHWGRDDGKEQFAKDHGMCRNYSWVIPNAFDLDDWTPSEKADDYILYMGRISELKGMSTLVEIVKNAPHHKYIFAGQGDFKRLIGDQIPRCSNAEYVGAVTGRDRDRLVGRAMAMLMPTEFIEPFGGAGVEGQLTGTPLIAVDFGAFTETVIHGINGFRCKTLGDWLVAIEAVSSLDRRLISNIARQRYSLETCAYQYKAAFSQILDLGPVSADGGLHGSGWYTPRSYRIESPMFEYRRMEIEERPQAARLASYFKDTLFPNDTILDVGCATGFYVDELRSSGLEAMGIDCTEALVESDYLFRMDVTDPDAKAPKASVVLSLEVAEHIDECDVERYFNFIERTSCHTVYFSAAAPGQGGVGHVNCQEKAHWVKRFADCGFVLEPIATDEWISFMRSGHHMGWLINNGMVFRKVYETTKQSITVRWGADGSDRTSAGESGNGTERPATDQGSVIAAGNGSDNASAGTRERLQGAGTRA